MKVRELALNLHAMLGWYRRRKDEKTAIGLEADALMKVHGGAALGIAYSRASDMAAPEDVRYRALAVRREIERRTGHKSQTDTATRYLDSGSA